MGPRFIREIKRRAGARLLWSTLPPTLAVTREPVSLSHLRRRGCLLPRKLSLKLFIRA
jgi:hypothetical protein